MINPLLPWPKKLVGSLFELFVPDQYSDNDTLRLIIRLRTQDISVRQFAAYLNFIDRAYGRLMPKGIIHYSRTHRYELKISKIEHGSIEIIISNLLSDPNSIKALIIVGLLLKYLPEIFKSALSTYHDYEEGRLSKARRQQITERIKKDEKLTKLTGKQVNQLCNFLDLMYKKDIRNLSKAQKFSKETVIEVIFHLAESTSSPRAGDGMRKIRIHRSLDID